MIIEEKFNYVIHTLFKFNFSDLYPSVGKGNVEGTPKKSKGKVTPHRGGLGTELNFP